MKQDQTLVKIVQSIFAYWKIKSFRHYQTDHIKELAQNCFDGVLFIVENFCLRKEELDQQSQNCVARNKCLLKMHDQDTVIEQSLNKHSSKMF